MRIAILGTRGYPVVYSGYETFVSELVPRLAARGHEVTVYCHREYFEERPAEVNGVKLVYIPSIQTKSLAQLSSSFFATMHAVMKPYDILFYINSANGPFGMITRAAGRRTLINVDGMEWLRPKWKGLGSKYFYWASKMSTRHFDRVVTDAYRMGEIYEELFGCESEVIAYGADAAESIKPERVREVGVEPGEYYLVIGRLIPDNNADLIVEAFRQTGIQKKLLICGDVPYKDEFARRIRSTDDPRVITPGHITDRELVRELFCNSYAYIHGHQFGGTNPTLLEALGFGCCVVAHNVDFNREVLAGDRHAFYFDKNVESARRIFEWVDENPEAVAAKRATASGRIAEAYTWDLVTDQYEALFEDMMRRPGRQKPSVTVRKGSNGLSPKSSNATPSVTADSGS